MVHWLFVTQYILRGDRMMEQQRYEIHIKDH
jgi:hypothetical protein